MTSEDIEQLVSQKSVPHPTQKLDLVETHISWVLLADRYAYKIKKPFKLSFLDFSDLGKRRLNCEREVVLNRRMAPEIYLGVLPVVAAGSGYRILDEPIVQGKNFQQQAGGVGGSAPVQEPVDFAVWMRRMDETRQLDVLIRKGKVEPKDMENLARKVASFHTDSDPVREAEDWEELEETFRDLQSVLGTLGRILDKPVADQIRLVLSACGPWLKERATRIEARKKAGYVRDGHGDLHCRNVILSDPPVVFDCIEFDDSLRTLDVLSEIGFLCMDLERMGRPDLSKAFSTEYFRQFPCMDNPVDSELFLFYKMSRANVRLKVETVALETGNQQSESDTTLGILKRTAALMLAYAEQLGIC